jgi:hypothetical protein
MENLLWVREVVVYLLVEDVEYDVQEVPVRWVGQAETSRNENMNGVTRRSWNAYHMKKKKPVTRAGYFSAKLVGLASLWESLINS